ncbi:hypothetical protein Tco_0612164 [Tanacetum coccineum]
MKVEESLNVTFDESPPPTKLSPLVDDDFGEEEAIENITKVVNNSNEEDASIEVDEVVNIKESKNHPLEQIIMVNVIPPDHVDDVPVVEPNQHDDVPVPELPYPMKRWILLTPPPPASDVRNMRGMRSSILKFQALQCVENPIESEDEIVLASVHEVDDVWSRDGAMALVERKEKVQPVKYYGKLILDLGNEVRSSVEQGTAVMEKLVEKLGNTEDKVECKKLKKELEEGRLSSTFLCMQNERVERDLYWTRIRAHEFYQEMIRRGFVSEERPNEAINVPIEDEKSPSSKPLGSPHDA